MAAVFALAPAVKAGIGALGLGLGAQAVLKNVKLPGARPDVTADVFPPSRVKLGDSHRLEVIAAPENPSNALATTPSKPRAKVFFTAANNPLKPAALFNQENDSESPNNDLKSAGNNQPNGGGGGKPPPDWYKLSAGVSGGIVGLDKYLDLTDYQDRTCRAIA